MADGLVETVQGVVRGVRDGRAWTWLGLPYAAPPVGPRRFGAPQPARNWTGIRDASMPGPAMPQQVSRLMPKRALGSDMNEDSLVLNVWSPAADGRRRPVMVWVHGGAFVSGSGTLYKGGALATLGDIVVVTINYRLGVFGFVNFSDTLGCEDFVSNAGLRDVVAALEWVKANVAAFGGDPDHVTLAGESAGSIIVSLLMLADAARPLFHQAIMQSGTFSLVHSRERSQRIAAAYLDHLGMSSSEALRAAPVSRLLDAQTAVGRRLSGTAAAAPWFDGELLPATHEAALAKDTASIPLLAGTNKDEIVLFKLLPGPGVLRTSRKPLLELVDRDLASATAARVRTVYPENLLGTLQLGTDLNFGMPMLHLAERHAARAPVWLYRFDYTHPVLRACHALELLFLWPFPGVAAAAFRGGFLTGLRSGLSERMRAAWTTFVRDGTPGADWPAFTAPKRETRLFDLQDQMAADPDGSRREAWGGVDAQPGR